MLTSLVLIAGLGLVPKVTAPTPTAVHFAAADGVEIYANVYRANAPAKAAILLFHQAGSSKSEYATIAPRLAELGYDVLAVDQRSGGALYDPPNETVLHLGASGSYASVLRDMDAAVAYAERRFPAAPLFAWGSSYSAGLVFALAARRPHEIAAVLAFSPGEYFTDKHFVRSAARRVSVPVFVDSAAEPSEVTAARSIVDALPAHHKVQYVPAHGIHGSSTLRDDRDPGGAAENWNAVTSFLASVDTER